MFIRRKNFSISAKFIVSVTIVFVCVGCVAVGFGIRYVMRSTLSNTTQLFNLVIASYSQHIETIFIDSMNDGRVLADEIAEWYKNAQASEWNDYFANKYYVDSDNAVRTKYVKDDTYGVFVSNLGSLNDRVKQMILATEHKIQVHQKAAATRFLDTYIVMPEQMILLDDRDWIQNVPPNFDFFKQEWAYMGTPQHNPDRKSVWSSIYYDPLLKYWMISNATPMYDGDDFLGTVGHDITLDVLFKTVSAYQNTVQGGQHLIISAKGVVMYDPAYKTLMEQSPETFDYQGREDQALLAEIQNYRQELSEGKTISAEITLHQTRYIVTCAAMPSVDWYYVQLVPYRAILTPIYSLSAWFAAASVAIVMILSGVIYVLTRQIITRPLGKGVEVFNQLADGNLLVAIETTRYDEIGQLLAAMQRMVQKLKDIVTKVKEAADTVAVESRNLTASVEAMSQGASQQAAAAEETSSSMEEMAANIRQSADNAQAAEQIALQSAEEARQGGMAVAKTIAAMQKIEERTTSIQQIALQTHLLSMNATIEAAKAEEYGKGFAVVATEVRSLAGRSREAADEIEALVKSCVTISAEAGQILQRLMPTSEKAAELIQEIRAASVEQLTNAEHVNTAVQQLDGVIQENAASSEQLAASADKLAIQAGTLQKLMAFFTVTEGLREPAEKQQQIFKALQSLLTAFEIDAQAVTELLNSMNASPQPDNSEKILTESSSRRPDLEKNLKTSNDELDAEFERF